MTPAANTAFLIRFKAEVDSARAELAASGQVDPYFRAKAFFRACEHLPPLPERITRIRPTSPPPSPLAREPEYDPACTQRPSGGLSNDRQKRRRDS